MDRNAYNYKRNARYYECVKKAIAALLSALPQDQQRGAAAGALRMLTSEYPSVPADGSSIVFPFLAIPEDANLPSVINLISGMGAVVLAMGQAKPSTPAKDVMKVADMMMGKDSVAFMGDPQGIGMPVASAIAAAASADPEIIQEAEKAGLNKIIAAVSEMYDCVGHKGPLGMVDLPDGSVRVFAPDNKPMAGGFFDTIKNIFNPSADSVANKAERKVDRKTQRADKLDSKIDGWKAEIADLEAQLATTNDTKARQKIQKKIEKLQKKIQKRQAKADSLREQIEDWQDVADKLNDEDADGNTGPAPTPHDDNRERGEENLRHGSADILAAASALEKAGVPTNIANILAGYLIPAGIKDALGYVSTLSAKLSLSIADAAKYAVYSASGMSPSEAMDAVAGKSSPPQDIADFLSEAKAKNDAYRLALQQQISALRSVNETAQQATRLYVRSEWADAIMSSSDEVADLLQTVSPDASSTTSLLQSLLSLIASARDNNPGPSAVKDLFAQAVRLGHADPGAAYMFTGDPDFLGNIHAGDLASTDNQEAATADGFASAVNPVVAEFNHTQGV